MATPNRFETLDSDAISDERPWSAHIAKTFARMRARLRRKEQGLIVLGGTVAAVGGEEWDPFPNGDSLTNVAMPFCR